LAAPPATTAAALPATGPANGVGSPFELAFWQSLTGGDDLAAYEAYLAKYPDGTFSGLARAKIAAMQRVLTVQRAAPQLAPPTPLTAPVPAAALAPAPAQAPIPAVVTAANPAAAPLPSAATASPLPAEMIPANASLPATEQSTPLAKLLAQLRRSSDAATSASAAPITAAPPVQPRPAAAPLLTSATALATASAPVPQPSAYAQAPALAPAGNVSYASARPIMLPVPDVAMPAYFCSNNARNAFHNAYYRPAVEAATRNNEAAVGYLRQLQQTYDQGQLGRDTTVLNAIATEARTYQAEAARAYSAQAMLVRQFDVLMTVPLRNCTAGTQ
jgi:hypothetical protein